MKLYGKRILAAAITGCLILTGCSSSGASDAIELSSTTVTGQVTKVDGKNVTLTLGVSRSMVGGNGAKFNRSDATENGQIPEKPNDSDAGAAAPEQPSGDDTSTTPSATPNSTPSTDASTSDSKSNGSNSGRGNGNMPGGMGQSFISSDTTASITISDESIINVEVSINSDDSTSAETGTKQGSLSDITEGAVLSIELDDNGAMTKITVLATQSMGSEDTNQTN